MRGDPQTLHSGSVRSILEALNWWNLPCLLNHQPFEGPNNKHEHKHIWMSVICACKGVTLKHSGAIARASCMTLIRLTTVASFAGFRYIESCGFVHQALNIKLTVVKPTLPCLRIMKYQWGKVRSCPHLGPQYEPRNAYYVDPNQGIPIFWKPH